MSQAETVALPKRLPLVPQPENRDESTDKDAKLVNAYVEKGKQEGEFWVFKRPGLLQFGTTKVGVGLGVYNWLGDIYSIFGITLYKTTPASEPSVRLEGCIGSPPASEQHRDSS